MLNLKEFKKADPLHIGAVKELNDAGRSPMNPPEPFDVSSIHALPLEKLNKTLQVLVNNFKTIQKRLSDFELAIIEWKSRDNVLFKKTFESFSAFFKFFDEAILTNNAKEEKFLFPVMQKHFLKNGEHSIASSPKTAIDILEDEHVKIIQTGSIVFNMMGLATRIPDLQSRKIILEYVENQSVELIELIRLNIFRKENILYPLAQKNLSEKEFQKIFVDLNK